MEERSMQSSNNISHETNKEIKEKAAFDLNLIQQERFGDLLFYEGTLLAFVVADQSEAAVLQPKQNNNGSKPNPADDALQTLSIESWLFFIASAIFAKTAIARLSELEADPKAKSAQDIELLNGNRIATIGGIIKLIGFAITAAGNQIKYNSTQKKAK